MERWQSYCSEANRSNTHRLRVVDLDILWQTAKEDLPALVKLLNVNTLWTEARREAWPQVVAI